MNNSDIFHSGRGRKHLNFCKSAMPPCTALPRQPRRGDAPPYNCGWKGFFHAVLARNAARLREFSTKWMARMALLSILQTLYLTIRRRPGWSTLLTYEDDGYQRSPQHGCPGPVLLDHVIRSPFVLDAKGGQSMERGGRGGRRHHRYMNMPIDTEHNSPDPTHQGTSANWAPSTERGG